MRKQHLSLALALALPLPGCGFQPLYGEGGGSASGGARMVFDSVYVPPIELEGAGYELRNELLDALRARIRPDGTLYDLQVDLTDRNVAIGIQNETINGIKEVEITRYNYTLIASYRLIDRGSGKVLTNGVQSSLSSYDVVASPYATLVAQQDAQAKTARDIALQIRTRLAVYLAQQPSAPK